MKRILIFGCWSIGVAALCFALAAVCFVQLPNDSKGSLFSSSRMGFVQSFFDGSSSESSPVHVVDHMDIRDLEMLDVGTTAIDVVVRPGTRSTIELVLDGNQSCGNGVVVDLETRRVGPVVHVHPVFRQGVGGAIVDSVNCHEQDMNLAVEVPAQFKGGVRLKTISGDINVNSGAKSNVQLSSVSGAMTCTGQGRFSVSTTSGDIDATLDDAHESSEFHTVSGDVAIRFHGQASVSAEVNTVSGDTSTEGDFLDVRPEARPGHRTLRASLGARKGSVVVSTVSGDVRLSTK